MSSEPLVLVFVLDVDSDVEGLDVVKAQRGIFEKVREATGRPGVEVACVWAAMGAQADQVIELLPEPVEDEQ